MWPEHYICASWWRHQMETFSTLLALCAGNSPVFYFICAWTNGWVNHRDASDCRRHHVHYDVTAMIPYQVISSLQVFLQMPHAGEFPSQRPITRSFDFYSLICVWMNGSVNNREADDLRRHRAHYDVTVMFQSTNSHCTHRPLRCPLWLRR